MNGVSWLRWFAYGLRVIMRPPTLVSMRSTLAPADEVVSCHAGHGLEHWHNVTGILGAAWVSARPTQRYITPSCLPFSCPIITLHDNSKCRRSALLCTKLRETTVRTAKLRAYKPISISLKLPSYENINFLYVLIYF
jgi:hypothetical protein